MSGKNNINKNNGTRFMVPDTNVLVGWKLAIISYFPFQPYTVHFHF